MKQRHIDLCQPHRPPAGRRLLAYFAAGLLILAAPACSARVLRHSSANGPASPAVGPATRTKCSGVSVKPSSNIQNMINKNPTGTTFCFQPGTYNLTSEIHPRANDVLDGDY